MGYDDGKEREGREREMLVYSVRKAFVCDDEREREKRERRRRGRERVPDVHTYIHTYIHTYRYIHTYM